MFHWWITDTNTAAATPRSGTLTLVDCQGAEICCAAVTDVKPRDPVWLSYRPPPSWNRAPGDWDISLLLSKPEGIATSVYFNITPPNGQTGDVRVETIPHEGERNICVQFKLGATWALGSGAPVSDQQFWSGFDFDDSTWKDVTNARKVDEKEQVKSEDVQKQDCVDWQKRRMCQGSMQNVPSRRLQECCSHRLQSVQ